MSIETNLNRIADALEKIAANMVEIQKDQLDEPKKKSDNKKKAEVVKLPEASEPKVEQKVEEVIEETVVEKAPEPVVEKVQQMAPAVPFTDKDGLLSYVMKKYQSLGYERGAKIQEVLASMGIGNVNDVPEDKFAQFYNEVEKL